MFYSTSVAEPYENSVQNTKQTEDEDDDRMFNIRQKNGDASANREEESFTGPLRLYGVKTIISDSKTDKKNEEPNVEMPPLLLDDCVLEGMRMPTTFGNTRKRMVKEED